MKINKAFCLFLVLAMIDVGLSCKPPTTPNNAPRQSSPQAKNNMDAAQPPMTMMPSSEKQMGDGFHGNHKLVVPDEISKLYSGVKIRLEKKQGGYSEVFDVQIDKDTKLGDSGLTVNVITFLPNFFMDRSRISSIGTDPLNPACKIIIRESGKQDFNGWLFAKMPEVHAFPHEVWKISLVSGIENTR